MDPETANRLRKARARAGFKNASSAAKHFGWSVPTYLSNENGGRGFSALPAQRYAAAFGVNVVWLLTGQGASSSSNVAVPIAGYVGDGGTVYLSDEFADPSWTEAIDLPPGVYDEYAVFKVRGAGCFPAYRDGELILTRKNAGPPQGHLNRDCVIRTRDERTFLKLLTAGSEEDLFTLLSLNGPAIFNQRVKWAWPVEWTRKP